VFYATMRTRLKTNGFVMIRAYCRPTVFTGNVFCNYVILFRHKMFLNEIMNFCFMKPANLWRVVDVSENLFQSKRRSLSGALIHKRDLYQTE